MVLRPMCGCVFVSANHLVVSAEKYEISYVDHCMSVRRLVVMFEVVGGVLQRLMHNKVTHVQY